LAIHPSESCRWRCRFCGKGIALSHDSAGGQPLPENWSG
jgi:hypothetical protein